TWTAKDKGIGPNEFVDLPIQVANPDKEGEFKWDAYQTYDDGETVKRNGDEDAEKPSPMTKVSKKADVDSENNQSGNRSEEHTSELQSRFDIVCRLLLE